MPVMLSLRLDFQIQVILPNSIYLLQENWKCLRLDYIFHDVNLKDEGKLEIQINYSLSYRITVSVD